MISPSILVAVLRRYMRANLVLHGRPRDLRDAAGARIGRIESLTIAAGFVTVTGHCRGGEISLELADMVARTQIVGARGAFRLTLPWPPGLSTHNQNLQLNPAAAPPQPLELPHPFVPVLRQSLTLTRTVIRTAPDFHRWLRDGDLRARSRIKDLLGFGSRRPGGPLSPDLCRITASTERRRMPPSSPVTIVLPVFNALDLLRDCLARLAQTEGAWHLVVIEDCSTDPTLRPWLSDWVASQPEGRVTLIEASENRGFIASVNTAFAEILSRPATQTGPVVLLNSDALVPPGWLPRLLAPLLADPGVASVTPCSNDAEIFSVPAICARQPLTREQALLIDAMAEQLPASLHCHEAPTGVGFCMALSRSFLEQVPRFDPVFGRGYGEEVDWCRKTRALGGRHLGHAGLFVEHRGGASFGSEEKRRLILHNNAEITRRYPEYDREVQDFILADPMRSARMVLALAWAGSTMQAGGAGVPVYLAHAMGGGAEHWLAARITTDAQAGLGSVVLRVGGTQRWQLEVHGLGGTVTGWSDDFALIRALLAILPARSIIYSCGVGDSDPFSLPSHLLALHQGAQDRIEILMHDYFPVSPSFTLLDQHGRYRGLPAGDDPDHSARRPDGSQVTLAQWQAEWGRLMARADRLRCFCPYSADLLARIWPELTDRIHMSPHKLKMPEPIAGLISAPAFIKSKHEEPVHVAVLGNIAPHKGAALVQRLAQMPTERRGFKMMLLGNIDPAYPLPRKFCVHGDYRPEDILRLLRHYRITHWLIPSVWPETFSFTTHEALATGLPVLAFDIGAQGDAVTAAPNGHALAYDPEADLAARIIAALRTI